ncbi:hypothetical protein GGI11_005728, partial [Coemansia sp. RSA 2049]
MNPVERHRKKMHEREVKKNKETKKQMREAAVLYKDTTKLEDKIERYRGIKRKLTEEENGRLRYDPLSGDKEHNAIVEYDSSSDNEVIDEEVLGKEGHRRFYQKTCAVMMSGRCFQVDLLLSMNFIILQPMDRERTVANEEIEDVGVGVGVGVGTGA